MNIIRGATVPLVATAPLAATAPLGPPEILAWGPTFFENLKTATVYTILIFSMTLINILTIYKFCQANYFLMGGLTRFLVTPLFNMYIFFTYTTFWR